MSMQLVDESTEVADATHESTTPTPDDDSRLDNEFAPDNDSAPDCASAPGMAQRWRLRIAIRRAIARAIEPLARRAAKAYIAGDTLADALAAQTRLAAARHYATLGYWSDAQDDPADVADQYRATLDALAADRLAADRLATDHVTSYCSVKLPALAFRPDLLAQLAAAARETGVALHCDSHGIEDTDRTQAVIESWLAAGVAAGTTLPGRWRRSVDDACWAIECGLRARVVKGQWPDPADPTRDMNSGFLEVIDALAGSSAEVAVATHDVDLAVAAIERLRSRRTPVCWELLYGLPTRAALATARTMNIDVRVYVPFGHSYLPYALRRLVKQPRMAMWLLKDLSPGARDR